MNPNPLSDREKALEDQWVREKEKQMAKDRAAKKQQTAKDTDSGSKGQQQTGEEQK
ncbi:hypothetical protein C8A01DRAFT_39273 [Parachaetomium inaequale]|uniref:Uncharacterized protein n=1 Tax=Parachaetomium inaequale TaxID=2588326 RepID=A0AAN6PBA3_9PEZI|nr:hypothetical protein C8A01DRAFT_39273 [Parachaetomium inaequale]